MSNKHKPWPKQTVQQQKVATGGGSSTTARGLNPRLEMVNPLQLEREERERDGTPATTAQPSLSTVQQWAAKLEAARTSVLDVPTTPTHPTSPTTAVPTSAGPTLSMADLQLPTNDAGPTVSAAVSVLRPVVPAGTSHNFSLSEQTGGDSLRPILLSANLDAKPLTTVSTSEIQRLESAVGEASAKIGADSRHWRTLLPVGDVKDQILGRIRSKLASTVTLETMENWTDSAFLIALRKAFPDSLRPRIFSDWGTLTQTLQTAAQSFNPRRAEDVQTLVEVVQPAFKQLEQEEADGGVSKTQRFSQTAKQFAEFIGSAKGSASPKQFFRERLLGRVTGMTEKQCSALELVILIWDTWFEIDNIATLSAKVGLRYEWAFVGGPPVAPRDTDSTRGKAQQLGQSGSKRKHEQSPSSDSHGRKKSQSSGQQPRCTGCGRNGHTWHDCWGRSTRPPGFNENPHVAWKDSEAGRAWIANQRGPQDVLRFPESLKPSNYDNRKPKPTKGTQLLNALAVDDVMCTVTINTPSEPILTLCLLDTGCNQGNWGSKTLGDKLEASGLQRTACTNVVYSCLGGSQTCSSCFTVDVICKQACRETSFPITINIIDMIHHDLIVGRDTIIHYNLLEPTAPPAVEALVTTVGSREATAQPNMVDAAQTGPTVVRVPKSEFLDYLVDDSEDPCDPLEPVHFWEPEAASGTIEEIQIFGPDELQGRLRSLVRDFHMVFRKELESNSSSVGIPPMEIIVDEPAWEADPQGRTAPRVLTLQKQAFLEKQIKILLERGIIQRSYASAYSHPTMAAKQGAAPGEYRFCLDFRLLNKFTKSIMAWGLPNIRSLFQRLGAKRARYFAVLDLTSGYHQIPLAQNSRRFTAFMTFMGLFEFVKVPFGLKGAPAYFQRMMETKVLVGLVHNQCEVYIDDIIVFGRTEDEFIGNLRAVLECLKRCNIKASPKKTRLGLSEVSYLGHVVNSDGVSFSAEKKLEVYKTPRPSSHQEMKSFLGVANYFRLHIEHYATKEAPLQAMITSYKPSKLLQWDDHSNEAFQVLLKAINDCPRLHFIEDDGEVYLQTDASDYGIGGYLFQKRGPGPEDEVPIAFVSKALTKSQREKWATNEKEAYAIFYALTELEYLIRDIPFVLQTDHRNLTFINSAGSPRVLRWKLAIQEYDFQLEYIEGESNQIADHFSRDLAAKYERKDAPAVDTAVIAAMEDVVIPHEKYQLISQVHNGNVGHWGVERTMANLAARGERWEGMRLHVRTFCHRCPVCQKIRAQSPLVVTTPFTLAKYEPMERLNIDTVGPLPIDKNGNQYIIVIIDCFTRFVELYPAKTTTAESAAEALLHHIGRYGAPCDLQSDNGSQYVNETIQAFLDLIGTEHMLTLAYSHEENGMVERCNKAVMDHLRALMIRINTTSAADSEFYCK